MSKRTEKQDKLRAQRRAAKVARMGRSGYRSKYAKKREYLTSNRWNPEVDDMPDGRQSRQLFGFEVPDPKPWR